MVSRLLFVCVVLVTALVQATTARAQYSFTGTATVSPTGGATFVGTYPGTPPVVGTVWSTQLTMSGSFHFKGQGPKNTHIDITPVANVTSYLSINDGNGGYRHVTGPDGNEHQYINVSQAFFNKDGTAIQLSKFPV